MSVDFVVNYVLALQCVCVCVCVCVYVHLCAGGWVFLNSALAMYGVNV